MPIDFVGLVGIGLVLALGGALFYAFYAFARDAFRRLDKVMVCAQCGHHGPTRRETPGSILVELVLWLCFLIPGLIYSLWRVSARRSVCAVCGAATLVPENSPVGRRLRAQAAQEPAP